MSTLKTTNIAHPSATSNNIVLDSSSRVLVGTSSARANLFNSTISAAFQVEGALDNTRIASIISSQNTAPAGGVLVLGHQKSGAVGGNTAVSSGDELGYITFQGSDGTEFVEGASIKVEVDGTPGANDMPGRLVFSTTADGASSPTERMRITSNGVIQAGGSSASTAERFLSFCLGGTTNGYGTIPTTNASYTAFVCRDNSGVGIGTITCTTTSTAYNTSSDYRLKENVVPLTGAADRLNQLQVHRFNFIADPDKTVDGFLAHEAQAVVPECVTGTKDEVDADGNPVYQGIDQSKLVPLLTAALQEALAEIESLKARVTALEP